MDYYLTALDYEISLFLEQALPVQQIKNEPDRGCPRPQELEEIAEK